MHRLLAVALVCALLPQAALAQDTASPTSPDAPVVAPPLVSAPDEVEPSPLEPGPMEDAPVRAREPRGMPTAPRIILETLSGGAGTVAGGLLGVIVGIVTTDCVLFEESCDGAAAMGLGGMALGTALTTYAAGSLMRGRGGFVGTLIGASLGTGAGLLMITSGGDDALGGLALLAFPAIGATMGYELSRDAEPASRFSLTGSPVPVAPAFGTTRHGGFVGGLTGRF